MSCKNPSGNKKVVGIINVLAFCWVSQNSVSQELSETGILREAHS
jgi:hypothetical protein